MHGFIAQKPCICEDCLNKFRPVFKTFILEGVEGLGIYEYNDYVKKAIFLFKGCGDYELKDVFIKPYISELSILYRDFFIVPVPSSKVSKLERGYNQVEEMFSCLKNKMLTDLLSKTKDVKQHTLKYQERQKIGESLEISSEVDIEGKKILLVDDILTTGATLKACSKLILSKRPKELKILVVAKREFSKEEKERIDKNYRIFDN